MPFPTTSSPLARALAERNYEQPTPVQLAVLADDAVDRDLLVSAQTGSGKTVAYGLAMAKDLLDGAERFEPAAAPLALIVAPTRELALQVQRELAWLYEHADGRVVSCVGGMDPRREQRELAAGAHIVVGTPGRLCDHLRRGRLDISGLRVVVLDEADEMLNLGFREDMEFILETTPDTRRTLLFSATFPRGIVALAKQYQQQAFRIEVAGDEGGHADIEYRAIRVAADDVEHAVVNVLRFHEAPSALVFCNTREAVRHLQAALLERGFSVASLSGEMTQNERTQALQALRDGRSRVCVATDVAARGIDLPSLDLVIHADLPKDPEVMQHRSGRTGRAGRKGVSILLVPPARRRRAELLLGLAGIDVVWGSAPQADEIRKLDHDRLLQDAVFSEEMSSDDQVLAQALLAERSPEAIAAALARFYRARLPAPEDILDPGEGRSRDRDDRRGERTSRREDRPAGPRSKTGKASPRHGMEEATVWFRASIGRRKNAEARWLLPMICRRGGIDKHDIGAIKISDTTTEFEIAARVAESFAVKIKRPDKEDTIRIEPLADAPQRQAPSDKPARKPRHDAWRDKDDGGHSTPRRDEPRDDAAAKRRGKPDREARAFSSEVAGRSREDYAPRQESGAPFRSNRDGKGAKPKFDSEPGFGKKKKNRNKPGQAGHWPDVSAAKPKFGKKPKKKHRG
ncbi:MULTISPECIES: DEAD/DEAH box helicase [unclassified Bradyrhizobium]|uniref:DEAD/DEAH box helicase n=1 Tax=unclassified Bradyrhizobium TaxID=2631580 RepID=UPI001BAB2F22|nr:MULTISPECIES: DEAD/DEAH box helicase [unclassified Bradyrhizobium]MBR1207618.1 DEAD/DEAH box helicase [Bradyrhizobium sp. AUGA SZCCT0124]MBR1316034.1 DEAD/DEAH box helicase [Bradyrhizobium sp. AUGA SZCCT0051]MBR1344140.1 DEAD/DEAH box helicase [Bradyrhizobium sp. AUGA SZCCT0105]MBR1357873.1 DEAD/DEAH box helicase [Bradyrhizobium sp. AUGA SZCCT0045]